MKQVPSTSNDFTGWIKLHRKTTDSYFKETFCRNMAWIDLLLLANHEENTFILKGHVINVKRGQMVYAQETLARRWGWSRGKVDRFLKFLESVHRIEQHKSNLTTTITILNYELYQGDNTTNGQQTDTEQTPNGHRTDTNKNDKNEKNDKNINIPFEDFWQVYDKKVGNLERLRAKWCKLKDAERTAIMEYLPRYKKAQPDKKYRKNPDTFLNQRGWEHEIIGEIPVAQTPQISIKLSDNNSWF